MTADVVAAMTRQVREGQMVDWPAVRAMEARTPRHSLHVPFAFMFFLSYNCKLFAQQQLKVCSTGDSVMRYEADREPSQVTFAGCERVRV